MNNRQSNRQILLFVYSLTLSTRVLAAFIPDCFTGTAVSTSSRKIITRMFLPNNSNQRNAIDDDDDEPISSDDEDKRIRLPNLKYGYRTEYFVWDELVQIIQVEKDIAKLCRSIAQQRDYEIFKRDTLQQWKSILDYVLCTKFCQIFSPQQQDDGRFVADPPPETVVAATSIRCDIATAQLVQLLLNDFPYYTAPGIEHWVLWKLGAPCTGVEIERAKETLIRDHKFDSNKILHWVNPPNLQSLPNIDHVHIIGVVTDSASDPTKSKSRF